MTIAFTCPDCHRVHEEPLAATFGIAVECADCALEVELDRLARDGAAVTTGRLAWAA